MEDRRTFAWILTAVIAVSLVACADPDRNNLLTAPSVLNTPSALSAPTLGPTAILENAPFKGHDSGLFEFTQASCPADQQPLTTRTSGTGTLVGAYTFETQECFENAALAFAGSFRVTGSNGDALVGAYTGHVTGFLDDVSPTYVFTATVTGGTGRFVGATGTFSGTGQANLATFDESRTFSGTISAVRSSQS